MQHRQTGLLTETKIDNAKDVIILSGARIIPPLKVDADTSNQLVQNQPSHHLPRKNLFSVMDKLYYIFLVTLYFQKTHGFPSSTMNNCPTDCICYTDYLHNLESWKWVEPNVHYDRDDPEHESFNPYTEHNEVFENPKLHKKKERESMLLTVTCMIRSNDTDDIEATLNFIPRHTQVLSLIQAPGSGTVLIGKDVLRRFHSLVGLEIRGYSDTQDVTQITGDSFMSLVSLTYLNLETVMLQQISVENKLHEGNSRLLRINYTFNDVVTNELTSQLLIISPDKDESVDGGDSVLSYSEYKKSQQQKEKAAPLEPKFRVAFTGLPKLEHLRISGCNLHDISWDMFYKLDNLKYLLLDENDLLFLPDFVFYATTNLTVLSLSRNRILNLQTVGLAGLLYLQKLDATHNNITHLSELSLPPFPHLEVADFRYNPIESIFPNTFEIMNSTKTLYLGSKTTPLDLSPNSFFGLVSLTKLDIINVKIRLLEKSMLKGMPSLKILQMTGDIPRISYDAFGEVTQLEKLIVSNCGIRKISMDALFGLASLTEIDLSHNSLNFLPPGLFEEQVSLREVLLQHNQLTTLPMNLIENLPVKLIRLEGNPWHCSCDMKGWNPQQINRVKRYHIPPPNNTLCQRAYDKGSMCFETYEPKFEITYSYEKRVSPVCETPIKFKQRSVFQVLRKELKYCSVQENVENGNNVKSSVHSSKTLQALAFPENYSIDTLKALEKQLLAKPVKVKKNNSTIQVPAAAAAEETRVAVAENAIIQNGILLPNEDALLLLKSTNLASKNNNPISEPLPPSLQQSNSVSVDTQLTGNTVELIASNFPTHLSPPPTPNELVAKSSSSNPSIPSPMPAPQKNSTTPFLDKLTWLHSQTSNSRNKEKRKNRKNIPINPDVVASDPNTRNSVPAISRKSMKLARAQQNNKATSF